MLEIPQAIDGDRIRDLRGTFFWLNLTDPSAIGSAHLARSAGLAQ